MKQPYGRWESPITAELLAEGSSAIKEVVTDGDLVWWSESRPKEKGRSAICCRTADGVVSEVSPPETSVDTRVHSYGGSAWWAKNGTLYYFDSKSGVLYRKPAGQEPTALTPSKPDQNVHYADGRPTPDENFYICVRESADKNKSGFQGSRKNRKIRPTDVPADQPLTNFPINEIVAISTDGKQKISVLATGADFYNSPRVSPDGKKLAWIEWNHPNMSWDGTELWVADLATTKLTKALKPKNARKVAGGASEWIFQPEWKAANELAYVSDNNNWSALYICEFDEELGGGETSKSVDEDDMADDTNSGGTSSAGAHSAGIHSGDKSKLTLKLHSDLSDRKAEIAVPEWVFGESRYCFLPSGEVAFAAVSNSCDTLTFGGKATHRKEATLGEQVWSGHSSVRQVRPYKDGVVALAGSWSVEPEIIYVKKTSNNQSPDNEQAEPTCEVLYSASSQPPNNQPAPNPSTGLGGDEPSDTELPGDEPAGAGLPGDEPAGAGLSDSELLKSELLKSELDVGELAAGFFPPPENIEFQTPAGEKAFGIYYRPANPQVANPQVDGPQVANPEVDGPQVANPEVDGPQVDGHDHSTTKDKPPLIVMAHGGPTGAARTSLYLGHRFWTSRGFAVLDVNYRGSSGYGRKYRMALNGKWGEADVEDCVAGAQKLVELGEVNPQQLGIRGGSAGGLTVLLALALYDVFSCGAIRYGVVDLKALAETTHKFESRYLDRLIGSPEFYVQRSPINHTERLNTPMIIMSGTEDPVVPAAQSQALAEVLEKRGVEHELIMFEGEGHGFRQSQNLIRALEAELDFFLRVFGVPAV